MNLPWKARAAAWKSWLENMQEFIHNAGVTSASRKTAILLYLGGEELMDLVDDVLCVLDDHRGGKGAATYEDIAAAVTQYFNSTRAVDNNEEEAEMDAPFPQKDRWYSPYRIELCYCEECQLKNPTPVLSFDDDVDELDCHDKREACQLDMPDARADTQIPTNRTMPDSGTSKSSDDAGSETCKDTDKADETDHEANHGADCEADRKAGDVPDRPVDDDEIDADADAISQNSKMPDREKGNNDDADNDPDNNVDNNADEADDVTNQLADDADASNGPDGNADKADDGTNQPADDADIAAGSESHAFTDDDDEVADPDNECDNRLEVKPVDSSRDGADGDHDHINPVYGADGTAANDDDHETGHDDVFRCDNMIRDIDIASTESECRDEIGGHTTDGELNHTVFNSTDRHIDVEDEIIIPKQRGTPFSSEGGDESEIHNAEDTKRPYNNGNESDDVDCDARPGLMAVRDSDHHGPAIPKPDIFSTIDPDVDPSTNPRKREISP